MVSSAAPPDAGPAALRVEVADGDAGARLDRVLAGALAPLSRNRLKTLIEAGHVTAGAATITDPSYRVKRGQIFAIMVPDAEPAEPVAQAMPLAVIYEDESLIVIDKPAGLVVHPAPGNRDRTLVNALIAHCGESLRGIGGVRRPGIVHRLDKGTTGLMVAAKTDQAHAALTRAFAERRISRRYLALAWGVPNPAAGEIEGPIGRDPRDRKRMAIVSHGGRPALTHYRLERAFGTAASLVACRLATGRTHQIRVHLAARGHPLLGDPVYGRPTQARRRALPTGTLAVLRDFHRQALHAGTLGFDHPVTGEGMQFDADIPKDMKDLMVTLELTQSDD